MLQPDQMVEELERHISFVALLHTYSEAELLSTMADSQWSICDAVSHIMKWDEHFAQTVLKKVVSGGSVVLAEHEDVQLFNKQAVEYGRTLSPQALLEEAVRLRYELVSLLRAVPHAEFAKVFSSQSSYSLSSFVYEMFVLHDAHHRGQIEQHLASARISYH